MKTITKEKLAKKIEEHHKWLEDDNSGERLALVDCDLRWADLRWADLSRADLRWADLSGADLRWADLSGANIDFTGLDLACRHTQIKMDIEQIRQLLYTVYMQQCDDPEYKKIKSRILPYVKRWNGLERHGLKLEDKEHDNGK